MTAGAMVCELGPLTVVRDGESIAVRGTKAPLVLALLSLRPHGVATNEIIDRCWPPPDQPPTARRSLANVIGRLREALGQDGIETTENGYRLGQVTGSRRDEFLACARRAEALLRDGRVDEAGSIVSTALGWWRGEPWAGIDGVDAIEADRSFLAAARARMLAVLAESRSATGDAFEAARLWEQVIAEDPYNEQWWSRLARCHLDEGRRTDGLRALNRARRSLAQVGLLLGPELAAIEQQLLGTEPLGSGPAPVGSEALRHDHRPGPAADRFEPDGRVERLIPAGRQPPAGIDLVVDRSMPFVGRDVERRRIGDVLDGTGPARGVLIAGEPGVGKTRLLVESLRSRPDALVFAGRAERDGSGPLGPLADIVIELRPKLSSELREATDSLLAGLGVSLGWQPARPNPRARPPEEPATAAIMAAALRHVADADSARRTVVVIDDLQWAPAVVVAVLDRLLGSADDRGPAVLATYRSRPPDLAGAAEERVARLAVQPAVDTIELGPLSRADVATIAAGGRYAGDPEALADFTGANALFVTECVRSGGTAVPRPLRALIRARVAAVDDRALPFLQAAAACGVTFRTDLVARAVGLQPAEADRLVDDLFASGTLLPQAGRPEIARFTHALVVDALRTSVEPQADRRLRLALATTFREAGQPITRWIGHLLEAGSLVDPTTLVGAVELAIDALQADGDHEGTINLCQQALALDPAEEATAAIRLALGRAKMRAGHGDGREELARLADTARRLGDARLLAEVALTYAQGGAWANNADAVGPALLREALELLDGLGDAGADGSRPALVGGGGGGTAAADPVDLRARLLARIGGWNIFTSTLDERDRATGEVLETVRRSSDDAALVDALNARHIAISCPAALEATLAVEAELADLEAVGRGFSELAESPLPGTYWAADGLGYHRGIESRLTRPDRDFDPMTRFLLAVRANFGGRTAEARRLAAEALELVDSDVMRGNHLWVLVQSNWLDGDVAPVRALADERLDLLGGAPLRCTAMWARAASGDLAGADDLRQRVSARTVARMPELFLGGFGLGSATMTAVALDDAELGGALAEALGPLRDQMLGVPWASFPCGAFFLGVLEARWGDASRSVAHFDVADEIHRRMRADSYVELACRYRPVP